MLKEELRKRLSFLDRIEEKAIDSLKTAPPGKVYSSGKNFYFVGEDGRRRYIHKGDRVLAERLAQKEYDQRIAEACVKERRALEQALKVVERRGMVDAFEKMNSVKKRLVKPYVAPDDLYAEKWQAVSYEHKGFSPGDKEIWTNRNERVRSKSEQMIANLLDNYGVPYRYEYPVKLQGYGTVYTDFTILNRRTHETFYLEHLGMMDDPDYVEKTIDKINSYARSGIYIGRNLLLTFETASKITDTKTIKGLIEEYFL